MKLFGTIFVILTLIFCVKTPAYAEVPAKSFVYKWIYNELPFDEEPDDEFINEKREINRLYVESKSNSEINSVLNDKFQAFVAKEVARYGDDYEDLDLSTFVIRAYAASFDTSFTKRLQSKFDSYGAELANKLREPDTWNEIDAELRKEFDVADIPPEISFRLNNRFVDFCTEILGEDDPITLKHKINLIRDYGVLGDSKTVLEMSKTLLPKIEMQFGENSPEVVDVLNLMANDYEILGNYRESESTLRKAIEINKNLYGDESSPELVTNFVALNKLLKSAPDSDLMLELEKAAKNLPTDDLYRLGYFHAKFLSNHPAIDIDDFLELSEINQTELALSKFYRGGCRTKFTDIMIEESACKKNFGHYGAALNTDLILLKTCTLNFGNYHYRNLQAVCNLSDDYLTLDQPEDALALAENAYVTGQIFYGDEHPCTIRTIHSLTDVYRKMNRYSDALAKDLEAYELCKKIFVKSYAGEPVEAVKVLADIADDYRGLKNYSSAIKYYEEFLAKKLLTNIDVPEVAEARKNLAILYNHNGEYSKTIKLYDFLRQENNSYSLENLSVVGLLAAQTADVLGEALTAVGNESAAVGIYFQGLEQLEIVRLFNTNSSAENKRKWFAQTVPYYKKAASFFINQNDSVDAFRAAELCKGRLLAEQYGDLLAIYKGGLSNDDIANLRAYQEKIPRFRDDFRYDFAHGNDTLKFKLRCSQLRIVQNYYSFKSQLEEKYPQYHEALTDGLSTGIFYVLLDNEPFIETQIKDVIPQNHCYISFSATDDKILILFADDSGEIKSSAISADDKFFDRCELYHELNSYATISELNADKKYLWNVNGEFVITLGRENRPSPDAVLIKAVDDKDNSTWFDLRKKISDEISEKLMPTLEKFAGTSTNWIISPDAELNLVPFETLIYRGKMLIDSVNVSYVPSLAVMSLMEEAGAKNHQLNERKELFAMGNAVYHSTSSVEENSRQFPFRSFKWQELDGSAIELDKVSAMFTSKAIFRREQVTEKNLWNLNTDGELSEYKYLLFATHGLFVPENPELSSIVLSQGLDDSEFDGYVTVGEWLGYNLNSDLVYLSACESGRGIYQAGEGIIGIPYALTVAGNKDTVMSLWKVRDDATAEFTSAVFEKLRNGQSEVDALNETKREFLKHSNPDYRDPSIWAAFLLYGI